MLIYIMKGMVSAMDDGVGMVVEALRNSNMLDNTIIVFSADVSNTIY